MIEQKTQFQQVLESGAFSFSAEIGPPMSGSAENIQKKAKLFSGIVDAANITDNQTAIVRMSSMAAAKLALDAGIEPVVQIVCRDRNRIALQSDLLGAYALGLRNVLVLSGDHQSFGNQKAAKNVFDVDSIQLLQVIRRMCEEGVFAGGAPLKEPVSFYLGTSANPFAGPEELQLLRLEKKINAGAKFVQTQAIYNLEAFSRWMEKVRARGLHKRAHILAGIVVNKTQKSMEMTAQVPGMDIPAPLLCRMQKAEDKAAEGADIALELMAGLREIEGVAGLHVMAIGWESIVPSLAQRGGFLPRPPSACPP